MVGEQEVLRTNGLQAAELISRGARAEAGAELYEWLSLSVCV